MKDELAKAIQKIHIEEMMRDSPFYMMLETINPELYWPLGEGKKWARLLEETQE